MNRALRHTVENMIKACARRELMMYYGDDEVAEVLRRLMNEVDDGNGD